MINRELIRNKIVQIVYAYYQNGNKNIDVTEKELFFSLSKAYDLYNQLLLLIVELSHLASLRVEVAEKKSIRTNSEKPNRKFADNRFAAQLEGNKMLQEFRENQKKIWDKDDTFIRLTLDAIEDSDIYQEYMNSEEDSYEADREIWRKIYKTILADNEELQAFLEERSLYWNDDKEIVDTFVMKTIKRFEEKNGTKQELLPEYKDEDDKEFARKLFRKAILNCDYYMHLIGNHAKNWDLNRLAFMDVIIMQIALAEIFSFPSIPISVSINEYVSVAKMYSTPRSGAYVNGMLDGIAKKLQAEGKLIKN